MTDPFDASSPFAARIEDAEALAWLDMYAAIPDDFRRRHAPEIAEVAGVVCTRCASIPFSHLNAALTPGTREPATEARVDAVLAWYREAGVAHPTVLLPPHAGPAALPEWLAARGVAPARRVASFPRRPDPAAAPPGSPPMPSPPPLRALASAAALALLAALPNGAAAQPAILHSTVIRPDSARSVRTTAVGSNRSVMDTVTATFARLEAHVTTLAPFQVSHAPHRHPDEEVIVVLRGTLETTQEGVVRRAPAGSLIFQASNEMHGLRNAGADTAAYYVIRPAPRDLPRPQ